MVEFVTFHYISLSCWLQGFNTSLGQSFFESVAHILCDEGEKGMYALTKKGEKYKGR